MCGSQIACHAFLVDIVARLQEGSTSLYFAAQKGHTEVVRTLIAAGASVDEADIVRGLL